jgi:hypothetical protein
MVLQMGANGATGQELQIEINIYFLVDLVAHFLKLYVGCMRNWSVAMKVAASEIGF